ncbi:AraC family transcriptional regulator [Marinicrinis lubricantis]|uniref:AraC family transcriptional regulator n=1 Tax=Marinicrinis lubricantis TaxID=2086470 RepID=A0ABW1ILM6_9BACL
MNTADPAAPFYIESLGFNPQQESVSREEGYPCFHWLQTLSGEGLLQMQDQQILLPSGSGILLQPGVPHAYRLHGGEWSTYYITFGGPQVSSIITQLGIQHSMIYQWDEQSPFHYLLEELFQLISAKFDLTGLDHSVDLYRFFIQLKKHAHVNKQPSIHSLIERMAPLLQWLDQHYGNPDIGTHEMAASIQISPRHLNSLFQRAFGYTPYHYLLQLRIRKSKEFILADLGQPIKHISEKVGFRDVSHFIATFRKLEGTTPEKFRKLHSQ